MANKFDYNYKKIDNPYNDFLQREDSALSDMPGNKQSNVNVGNNEEKSNEIDSPFDVNRNVIDGNAIDNLWINKWIKSRSYKPGSSGFFIDGRTGNVEFNRGIFRGTVTLVGAEGDLDNIADGDTYGKVALTNISGGNIQLQVDQDLSSQGVSIKSSSDYPHVRLYPTSDIGIDVKDDAGNTVFQTLIGGTDVGDVQIGDYYGDQGILYDKSTGEIKYKNLKWTEITDPKPEQDADNTASHANDLVYQGSTAPSHQAGRIWFDTNNNNFKRSNGSSWDTVSDITSFWETFSTESDIDVLSTTNAPSQSGADVTADHADDIVYSGSVAPSHKQGRIWYDTDNSNFKRSNGSSWDTVSDITSVWETFGTESDIDVLYTTNAPAESSADVTGNNTAADSDKVQGYAVLDSYSNIKADHLTADNITTGTLDADSVTVSGTLSSVDLDIGSTIQIWDGATEIAKINENGYITRPGYAFWAETSSGTWGEFVGDTSTDAVFLRLSSNSYALQVQDADNNNIMNFSYYDISSYKSIMPNSSGTYSLGDASHKWDDVMCYALKGSTSQIWLDRSGRAQCTNHFDPTGEADYNLGGDVRYWNLVHCADISYHSLVDKDGGVELLNGKKVSNIEGLRNIKPSKKKNKNGEILLDKTSFPKEIYRPGSIAEEDVYEEEKDEETKERTPVLKYKKGEKMGDDSISDVTLTSMIISALKEIDNRLYKLENNSN